MRIKRIISLIMIPCFLIMLTGCWDSEDIDERAILTLVLTDKQDDEYIFYVEMPNLAKSGSGEQGGNEEYSFLSGRGKTLADARHELDSKLSSRAFLGQLNSVVLTGDMIKEDLMLYAHRVDSIVEFRRALKVAVTFEKPQDFLSVKPENNISLGKSVSDKLQASQNVAHAKVYTGSEILEFIHSKSCFVLPSIGIKEGSLAVVGYTVIHDGKYLAYIPFEESMGLLYFLEKKARWDLDIELEDMQVGLRVYLKNSKITPAFDNGNISFKVVFDVESRIDYFSRIVDLDEALRERIKQALCDRIYGELVKTVEFSQSISCDYLGFKNAFRIKYPNEAKKLEWCAAFHNSTVDISVNLEIDTEGMLDYKEID